MKNTRRTFLGAMGRLGLTGMAAPLVAIDSTKAQTATGAEHFDLVVIGTGFGGSMTSLSIAYRMEAKRAAAGSQTAPLRILLLERGTWWTTPLETVQDKNVATRDFLIWHKQPTQEWTSLNDARGTMDLLRRCHRTQKQPQGLYDFTTPGTRTGFFGTTLKHDGVAVLRASGVGGGSLVYSNITIRPPEKLFDDARWPGSWHGAAGAAQRTDYFRLAGDAISRGVEAAVVIKGAAVNTGLSNIVTRSGRLTPAWQAVNDPSMPTIPTSDPARPMRLLYQIRIADETKPLQPRERELIDRARVFQTAISKITEHYGTVDLAINDIAPEPFPPDAATPEPKPRGKNYCERQGRCNIGCLPGARHTLNKQLMRALYGDFVADAFDPNRPAQSPCVLKHVGLELRALTEVDAIASRSGGGYEVTYRRRHASSGALGDQSVITADRVIVAAGTVGTSELMLRCRDSGLLDLSDKVGFGFSTNGDHIAFLEPIKDRVSLTRGPVTTSFGQFNVDSPQAATFHNVEDQGIPRSLAALIGYGSDVMRALVRGDDPWLVVKDVFNGAVQFFRNETLFWSPKRQVKQEGDFDLSTNRPESEDELAAKIMCVVAQGKDDAIGQFRLENGRLRVSRRDGTAFHQDGVYKRITDTLDRLAAHLRPAGSSATFVSPLFGRDPMVLTSHPLGGCIMAESASGGVVDEWGRVFRKAGGVYQGLYIADGSVIPTALGVNPSLTIAAVALRAADKVLDEWDQVKSIAPSVTQIPECKV